MMSECYFSCLVFVTCLETPVLLHLLRFIQCAPSIRAGNFINLKFSVFKVLCPYLTFRHRASSV